ncbi:MAG: mandelate racemase/muconate lactonizing enzyme family protein, partial [Pseudomonadales bacterium]
MKLARTKIYELHLPMKFTFKHAEAERSEGSAVLVRLEDAEGNLGWGECAPRLYVTQETVESVVDNLKELFGTELLGMDFGDFEGVITFIKDRLEQLPRNQHAAFCAAELALLDIAGKVFGKSAGEVLGPRQNAQVHYSLVLTAGDIEQATQHCMLGKKFQMQTVKLKVGADAEKDKALLGTARQILGANCGMRIDANMAWSAEEAISRLEQLKEFNLQGIEQPLRPDDIEGYIWLTERSPVPVIVDETLVSYEDAEMLIDKKGCDIFNIRISKCGGLSNSARIRDLAERRGMGYMMGAQVGETAILTAAGRHFATHSAHTSFCEGSFGSFLMEADVAVENLTFGPRGVGPAL